MSSEPAATTHAILVPRETVNDDSVYLVRWALPDGAAVEVGAPLCDIETSKAVITLEAEHGGYVHQWVAAGDEAAIGSVLGYITPQRDTPLPATRVRATDTPAGATHISAKARLKIEELGLDPNLFAGRGLVREHDVLELAAQQSPDTAREDPRGPFRLAPLGPIQRRVARVMEQSVAAIPAAYLERTIDLAPVRQRARAIAIEMKGVVTEIDLLVSAVSRACLAHPHFNAFVTPDHQLHCFERVNVGVAVDVDGDLYVVVLHDTAVKSLTTIAKELRGLQYLAQRRRLGTAQLNGGTITVTSMIGRGIHRFQPIPYPHQAAIVGLADPEPESTRAALALVFDHRVANGSQAAAFLAAIHTSLVDGT